ncbi:MAG: sugar phosphate isomerase/epimerase [Acidobacteria bacterium]|nr:sugar phosphate isomerase/epimerase [Acidobacteriota bacterium]MBI3281633.1 sugar phosphate isomerase/epimerase [Acidobacteriota bacterium]
MKIGINLLLWTGRPTAAGHASLLERIERWGFDGVEFPVIAMEPPDIGALARRCDALGLKRSALLAYPAGAADPVSPDLQLRRAAVDLLKTCIEKTRDLGADILVGPFHQGLGRFTGAGPTRDEWNRSRDVIREAAQHAAGMHVRLAVEPLNRFEMFLTNTVADAARFAAEVGMPNVGVLADTHHSNIEEERPADAWARVAKHITHVHISENHRGIPGSGHAVTPAIMRALRDSGYDGWLTIEAFGLKVPDLVPVLHLWRPVFRNEEDVARLGLKHIRETWNRAAA